MRALQVLVLTTMLLAVIAGQAVHAQSCADFEQRAGEIRSMRDSQPAEGVAQAQAALDDLRQNASECRRAEALLHGSIGSNQHILGQNDQALARFEQALALADSSDDDVLAILHRGAGVVLADLDRLDLALEHYLDSLAASDRLGDAIESAKTSSNIGNLYNTLGELDEARDYHLRALERFEVAEWPMGIAGTSINLGSVWGKIASRAEAAGDIELARRANEQLRDSNLRALEIFRAMENRRGIAYASNNIATALDRLDDPESALTYHQVALDLRREIGDRFGEIQSLSTMADSHITLGNLEQAERLLDEADAIVPEDQLPLQLELAERRVRLAEASADYRQALDHQREITALRSAMAEEEGRLRVERLREAFDAEQREITIQSLQNEAMVAELRSQRQTLISQVSIATAAVLVILIALLYSRYRMKANASAELKKAAQTDPLTGLANRRYMREQIESGIRSARENGDTFSLIMADIDDFKPINDSFGHEAGDQALNHIAGILTNQLKGRDLVSRWGGEEFLIYLPQTSQKDAALVAHILKNATDAEPPLINGKECPISMTFGVVQYLKGESLDDCIGRADAAMYQGKRDGKNQIVSFESISPRARRSSAS